MPFFIACLRLKSDNIMYNDSSLGYYFINTVGICFLIKNIRRCL